MTNISFYLDFLIALVFILAITSNIIAILYETYAYYFKHRAKFLKTTIEDVLNDPLLKDSNLTALFYAHPQIDLTKKNYRSLPAYISSKNFAQTLIDVICRKYETSVSVINRNADTLEAEPALTFFTENQLQRFKRSAELLPYSDLKILLTGFINNSENNVEKLQGNIENWFNEYMNRATGWYKIAVQKKMFVISFVLAIVMNIDFFKITTTLLTDKTLTTQIAAAAENYKPIKVDSIKTDAELAQAIEARKTLVSSLYKLNAPIGWQNEKPSEMNRQNWFLKFIGWLLSAIALSFGAPFWFDALSKLINIRKAGIKPQNS